MSPVVIVAAALVLLLGVGLAVGRPLAERGRQVRIGREVRGTQPAVWWVVTGVIIMAAAFFIAAVH
jgi:hypothetical protein